ncbi:unnamed protein product, partial [Staurois parvus]
MDTNRYNVAAAINVKEIAELSAGTLFAGCRRDEKSANFFYPCDTFCWTGIPLIFILLLLHSSSSSLLLHPSLPLLLHPHPLRLHPHPPL